MMKRVVMVVVAAAACSVAACKKDSTPEGGAAAGETEVVEEEVLEPENGPPELDIAQIAARGPVGEPHPEHIFEVADMKSVYEPACEQGNASACWALSLVHQEGELVPPSPERAFEYGQQACEAGMLKACVALAERYLRGNGVAKDRERGTSLLDQLCEAEQAAACAQLANTQTGDGDEARVYALRACRLRGEACDRAHRLGATDEQLLERPHSLEAACDQGDGAACAEAGMIWKIGKAGMDKDAERGTSLLAKGCELGDGTACFWLEEFETSCQLGHGPGCAALAQSLTDANDLEAAADAEERACELGEGRSCHLLAGHYRGRAEGAADMQRAMRYYEKACELGEGTSCAVASSNYDLGELGVERDPGKAAALAVRACRFRHPKGCNNAGLFFWQGEGVGQDGRRAAYYLSRGCRLEDAEACYNGGVAYEQGSPGLDGDVSKATAMYREACRLGDQQACSDLGIR
jgi:TPR repeat protein